MPHSPRLHRGALWLLNSGTGELGIVDLPKNGGMGRFEPVAFCPGFLRGLALHGRYAFVGLSKPRYKRFEGLALDARLAAADSEPWCGVQVIDMETGTCVDWFRIDGQVAELYDLAVIPGVACPMAVSPRLGGGGERRQPCAGRRVAATAIGRVLCCGWRAGRSEPLTRLPEGIEHAAGDEAGNQERRRRSGLRSRLVLGTALATSAFLGGYRGYVRRAFADLRRSRAAPTSAAARRRRRRRSHGTPLTVTTAPGFTIDTAVAGGSGGNAFTLTGARAGLTFTDDNGSTITGASSRHRRPQHRGRRAVDHHHWNSDGNGSSSRSEAKAKFMETGITARNDVRYDHDVTNLTHRRECCSGRGKRHRRPQLRQRRTVDHDHGNGDGDREHSVRHRRI